MQNFEDAVRHTATKVAAAYVLLLGIGLSACTIDECDEALNKMTGECALGGGASLLGNGNGECTDLALCSAKCVIDADCDDITDKDQDTSYQQCLAECQANP